MKCLKLTIFLALCLFGLAYGQKSAQAATNPDPSWASDNVVNEFEIWAGASVSDDAVLTWDNGTLVCSANLEDSGGSDVTCASGDINPSQEYRVQMYLDNAGARTSLNMDNSTTEYVDHVAVKGEGNWAGWNPTLGGSCGFYDVDSDDTSTTCNVAWNSTNNVRITQTGTSLLLGDGTNGPEQEEGFMYLITTTATTTDSNTSYLNTDIDGYTQASTYITINAAPNFGFSSYRLYNTQTGTTVPMSVLANENATGTLTVAEQAFQLRTVMHNYGGSAEASSTDFTLQFAEASGGNCVGASYVDVTTATNIAFYDNSTVADDDQLSATTTDPSHGSDTIRVQAYEESNDFTNSKAAISNGEDGLWGFSLYNKNMSANIPYCFKVIDSSDNALYSYDHYPQVKYIPVFYSAADQAFGVGQADTVISTITITASADNQITSGNDIRIAIASTSVAMKWKTDDLSPVIGGDASSKVNTTAVTYTDDYILNIDVTSDFNTGDTITISGLSFSDFASANAAISGLEVYFDGSYDGTPNFTDPNKVTIYGALSVDNHTLGNVGNKWLAQTSTTTIHYQYSLVPDGEGMVLTTTVFDLSDISGVIASDFSDIRVIYDANGDGIKTASSTTNTSPVYQGTETIIDDLEFDYKKGIMYAKDGNGACDDHIIACDVLTGCETSNDWELVYNGTNCYGGGIVFYDDLNNILYAGMDRDTGQPADILRCETSTGCDTTSDWIISWDGAADYTDHSSHNSMVLDKENGVIYVGTDINLLYCQTNTGCNENSDWNIANNVQTNFPTLSFGNILYIKAGDYIYRCDPANDGDSDGICETGEWTQVYYSGGAFGIGQIIYDPSRKAMYFGSYSLTSTATDGDLYRCDISSGCDETSDWSSVYEGTSYRVVPFYNKLNGALFIMQGQIMLATGELYRCDPSSSCNSNSDWALVFSNSAGSYPIVSMELDTINNVLYFGTYGSSGEDKIYQKKEGDYVVPNLVDGTPKLNISGNSGTITIATSSNYSIMATTTNFFLELTASNLEDGDMMTIDFGSVNATGSISAYNIPETENASSTTHVVSPVSITSSADQVFALEQVSTAMSPLRITAYTDTAITSANDLYITIATSSFDFRFDTSDVTETITGTASGKVGSDITYISDSVMKITVNSNFAANEYIDIAGLSYNNFNTAVKGSGAIQLYADGNYSGTADAADPKTVTIYGTLTSGNHTLGQVGNKWEGETSTTTIHYRYSLLPGGGEGMTLGETVFNLSGINGVSVSDLSSITLYKDNDSDGFVAEGEIALSFDGAENYITSFAYDTTNNVIYAGNRSSGILSTTVVRCQPGTDGDGDGLCETGEWTAANTDVAVEGYVVYDPVNDVVYVGRAYSSVADIYYCRPNVDGDADGLCEPGEWSLAHNDSANGIRSFHYDSTNACLYAGNVAMSNADIVRCCPSSDGDGDGLCEAGEWVVSFNSPLAEVASLYHDTTNDCMYAGHGWGAGEADIYRCCPSVEGDLDGLCETGEWTITYDGSNAFVQSLTHDSTNDCMYAGMGDTSGDGDIYRCCASSEGDSDGLCETGEWTLAYSEDTRNYMYGLGYDSTNDCVYAGQGEATGHGDILRCCANSDGDRDGVCETGEWSLFYDGNQEIFQGFMHDSVNNVMYAGQGTGGGDGDIYYITSGSDETIDTGFVSISGTTGTITFATTTTYSIGTTSTDFLLKFQVDSLEVCDQMTIDFGDISATGSVSDYSIDYSGAPSSVMHYVAGSLTLSEHDQGQVSNQWLAPYQNSSTTQNSVHYRYSVTPNGTIGLSTTTISLASLSGVSASDISDAKLIWDVNGDGDFGGDMGLDWATTSDQSAEDWGYAMYEYGGFLYLGGDTLDGSTYDWRIEKRDTDGNFYWATSTDLGSPSGPLDIYADSSGVYAAGYKNPSQYYGHIEKRSLSDGSLIWATTTFSNSADQSYIRTIVADDNYVYVCGEHMPSDPYWFIYKLNKSDGSMEWSQTINVVPLMGELEKCYDVKVDDSYVYVTGDYPDIGSSNRYVWIDVLYKSNATRFWGTTTDDGTFANGARSIHLDSSHIYIAGINSGSATVEKRSITNGNVEWTNSVSHSSVNIFNSIDGDSDNIYLLGSHGSTTDDATQDFLVEVWSKQDASNVFSTTTDNGSADIGRAIVSVNDISAFYAFGRSTIGNGDSWYLQKYNKGDVQVGNAGIVEINGSTGSIVFVNSPSYDISTTTDFLINLTVDNLQTGTGVETTPPFIMEGPITMEGDIVFEGAEASGAAQNDSMTMDLGSVEVGYCQLSTPGNPSLVTHEYGN